MTFSEQLLPEFDEEMKNTRKMLERVPDGIMDYKPHEKSMALGRLALHVAELPGWTVMTVDQDVLDMQPGFQPQSATTQTQLLEAFDAKVAEARPKIAATSDEKWAQTWEFRFGGKPVFSMPRGSVMRSVIMNHMIHHRAQLGVYLRLNNVEIPGVYGPSADEMRSWDQA